MPQPTTSPGNAMLGNDVVDFHIDEQKYNNPRFVNRILTRQEQHHLKQSANPNRFLWSLWAAKEAGYKARQRHHQQLTFSPMAFALSDDTLQQILMANHEDDIHGDMFFEKTHIEVKFSWLKPEVVHCLALIEANNGQWSRIDSQVACVADLKTYQQQSEAARNLAAQLLQCHGINADIVRPKLILAGYQKPGPPVLIDCNSGQPLPDIISLSHDHDYVAVALYRAETVLK